MKTLVLETFWERYMKTLKRQVTQEEVLLTWTVENREEVRIADDYWVKKSGEEVGGVALWYLSRNILVLGYIVFIYIYIFIYYIDK